MLKGIMNTGQDIARIGFLIGRKIASKPIENIAGLEGSLGEEFVRSTHPERIKVRVSKITDETPSTLTFRLIPVSGHIPPFRAGQYVSLALVINGVKTARPYSISSPPTRRGYIEITVRKLTDGFVSKYLCEEVAEGDEFEISGPAGSFYLEPLIDTGDLVFLAGGSGITPFMSIIRELYDRGTNMNVQLLYGSRTPQDIIFEDELSEITCSEKWLKTHFLISEPPEGYEGKCGLLDASTITEIVGDLSAKTFFLCGPLPMLRLCSNDLSSLGVQAHRIRSELPGPPLDVREVPGYPEEAKTGTAFQATVHFTGGKRKSVTFPIVSDETLLCSLERNMIAVENLCRSGECGFCRLKLLSGKVFVPPWVKIKASDLAMSYIHPCMSYPISDIELRV